MAASRRSICNWRKSGIKIPERAGHLPRAFHISAGWPSRWTYEITKMGLGSCAKNLARCLTQSRLALMTQLRRFHLLFQRAFYPKNCVAIFANAREANRLDFFSHRFQMIPATLFYRPLTPLRPSHSISTDEPVRRTPAGGKRKELPRWLLAW